MSDAQKLAGTPDRDALAAKHFPAKWAAVVSAHGKSRQRNKLRNAAVAQETLNALRAEGASCGNCRSYEKCPSLGMNAHHCERDSNFHGYAITVATNLCVNWAARKLK